MGYVWPKITVKPNFQPQKSVDNFDTGPLVEGSFYGCELSLPPASTYYMLNLKLLSLGGIRQVIVFVEYVDQTLSPEKWVFEARQIRLIKRVIRFKSKIKAFSIVLGEHQTQSSVDFIFLERLLERRAISLMNKKLKGAKSTLTFTNTETLYKRYDDYFTQLTPHEKFKAWLNNVEPTYNTKGNLNAIENSLTLKPTFSILLPVYKTDLVFLKEAIDSVINQSYDYWELCIADDASNEVELSALLAGFAVRDPRIKVVTRQENGHISLASNSALSLATGEYVALLDHDDRLSSNALLKLAEAINLNPDVQFFYSDEDKLSTESERFEPHFKPDWNRDLFYSHNYITHLAVIKTALIRGIGGFRVGYEGSQDYDLFLRCISKLTDNEIFHIPEILYHWRSIEGSTALDSSQKTYTSEAGLRALKDHLVDNPQVKSVELHALQNAYRVKWQIPNPSPKVSLIIPTKDAYELIYNCVESIIKKTIYPNYEIIIVDNQTRCKKTLNYLSYLEKNQLATVIPYPDSFNYSSINNLAVKRASGSVIGLINNDIEVINDDWLCEMVSHAVRPDVGCVGAKLYYSDGTIQHAGVILGIGGVAGHGHKGFSSNHHGYMSRLSLVQNYSAVTAAALVVEKAIFEAVGGLNEGELKVAFNDVDLCLKIRELGYKHVWTPFAELYHHESVTRGFEDTVEKQLRFKQEVNYMKNRWGGQLTSDPAYNVNLSNDSDDFTCRVITS